MTERISRLAGHARIAQRLRAWVEALVELPPLAPVAKLTGLHWCTIREIDRRRLQEMLGTIEGRGARRVVMDEFALH